MVLPVLNKFCTFLVPHKFIDSDCIRLRHVTDPTRKIAITTEII